MRRVGGDVPHCGATACCTGLAAEREAEEVQAAIRTALPEAELDPPYARIDHPAYTVELDIGADDPVEGLGVRVQGGDEAVEPLLRLCAHTGWRALDVSTGAFLDESDDPAAGLRGWRAFRDSVVEDS